MLHRPSFLPSLGLALALSSAAIAAQAADFTLTSSQVHPGQMLDRAQVFNGFGCHGANQSPALSWTGVPAGTRSLAVTVYDPDAPTGSGWWHWVVHDLPASTTGLPAGAGTLDGRALPPPARQVRTDFGSPGFGGACPPVGDKPHRYVFTVHALKVERLDLPPDATAAMVGYFLTMNRLGQATLEARYGR